MTCKILFVVNDPAFFLSHRAVLALAACEAGYQVEIATGPGPAVAEIVGLGLPHYEIPLSRSGLNPLAELQSLFLLYRLYRRSRPDLVHLVTIKPVIYGGLAARFAGVPAIVAAISGLGTIFIGRGRKARLMRHGVQIAYKLALGARRTKIVFQNTSDRDTFVKFGIEADRTVIISGSGVDLSGFPRTEEPALPIVVTMACRLLRDKGLHEFLAAANLVKYELPDTILQLAGDIDPGNPTSLTAEDCAAIELQGKVRLLGHRKDMAEVLGASHIVVLPSYREGLPKVLIEAAATGRAVVTTDVPGCRDAIEPGRTGLLVPPHNVEGLAEAIASLVKDDARRRAFGRAGRAYAERQFDVRGIIRQHLEIYQGLTKGI